VFPGRPSSGSIPRWLACEPRLDADTSERTAADLLGDVVEAALLGAGIAVNDAEEPQLVPLMGFQWQDEARIDWIGDLEERQAIDDDGT
jgi:hypothetical protein